ncbi:MAG: hypothetical protein ISR52_04295 [Rhodospirillales bacterium]|nr:hypothetical protein [Rhodospirillales bacterium]
MAMVLKKQTIMALVLAVFTAVAVFYPASPVKADDTHASFIVSDPPATFDADIRKTGLTVGKTQHFRELEMAVVQIILKGATDAAQVLKVLTRHFPDSEISLNDENSGLILASD